MKKFLALLILCPVLCKSQTCDSITNLIPENPYYTYGFSSAWGYVCGHNGNNFAQWVEKFSGTSGGTLTDIQFIPGRAFAATPSSYVTFKVFNGGANPGAVLGTQQVQIAGMQTDTWNTIHLSTPVVVGSDYYIGFLLNYNTPVDTFVVVANSPKLNNTAYLYFVYQWMSFENFFGGEINTSMAIRGILCHPTEIESPNTEKKPLIWNDGHVLKTSGIQEKGAVIEVFSLSGTMQFTDMMTNSEYQIPEELKGLFLIRLKTENEILSRKVFLE